MTDLKENEDSNSEEASTANTQSTFPFCAHAHEMYKLKMESLTWLQEENARFITNNASHWWTQEKRLLNLWEWNRKICKNWKESYNNQGWKHRKVLVGWRWSSLSFVCFFNIPVIVFFLSSSLICHDNQKNKTASKEKKKNTVLESTMQLNV